MGRLAHDNLIPFRCLHIISGRPAAAAASLPTGAPELHNRPMFDWNDLKYFLAVARHGSTIAAAKALRTSQSTVQRRLSDLESKIGRELAARQTAGYRLTPFGEKLLPLAERVEAAIADFEQCVTGEVRVEAGVIRMTCPEPIIPRLLPIIEQFHTRHPRLRVEFVTSDRYLDLAKGEADVALRSGDTEDELIGRKIADSIWAVYASRAYIEQHGKPEKPEDLKQHRLVSLDEAMSKHRLVGWLNSIAPNGTIAARNNSILGLMQAVKSGLGVSALPIPMAEQQEDLVRLFGPVAELSRSWRLLTHPDLRRTKRISLFFDFIVEQREALKPILTG
jgi:DNA-binding transcriptional LysR family regulator